MRDPTTGRMILKPQYGGSIADAWVTDDGLHTDTGRFMELAPWLATWPGLALTIVVYSLNMLGDALRDLLAPRLKGGVGHLGAHNRAKQV